MFGLRFFFVLSYLELRITILLVRIGFTSKILAAKMLLKDKKIKVNSKFIIHQYIVQSQDLLLRIPKLKKNSSFYRSSRYQ